MVVAAVAKIPVWPPAPSVRKTVAAGLCGIICIPGTLRGDVLGT